MPVHPDLIDLAKNGDTDAVKLMMKWGYEGSKKFIGGNPVERIIQSPRDIREILAVDLIACNNYCLLYTSPSPRDSVVSRMPSSA